jgi:hypothetical protein
MTARRNTMTSTAALVAEALRAAGHSESTGTQVCTTGFFAVSDGAGRVIVIGVLGDDVEGHPESPAHTETRTRMAAAYGKSLEAAGWAVDDRRTGLVVTGRTKSA